MSGKFCILAGVLTILFVLSFINMPAPLRSTVFKKPIEVVGVVDGIPSKNILGSRFMIDIEKINGEKHRGRLVVAWYRRYGSVHPGERWRWVLKLKPIHGLQNPGGFDFYHWAKMQSIIASGYVYKN